MLCTYTDVPSQPAKEGTPYTAKVIRAAHSITPHGKEGCLHAFLLFVYKLETNDFLTSSHALAFRSCHVSHSPACIIHYRPRGLLTPKNGNFRLQ